MDVILGDEVGYSTSYEDCTNSKTVLKYITSNLLLHEAVSDPLFEEYACVLIDDIQKRNIENDILLALLKIALKKRNDS